MQTINRIFDDVAKVGTGLIGIAIGVKNELRQNIRNRFERCAQDMNLVNREEFEVVRDMAQQARIQGEDLEKRVGALEKTASKPGKKTLKTKKTTQSTKTSKK